MNLYSLDKLVKKTFLKTVKDTSLYSIKPGTPDHLKLLYHNTIEEIFNIQSDLKNVVFIDDLKLDREDKFNKKYLQFISKISKYTSIKIIKEERLQQYQFDNILTNRIQNATVKSKNFSKLQKFGKKFGLTHLVNIYLESPKYKYILGKQ
jgi:hypothetical protein